MNARTYRAKQLPQQSGSFSLLRDETRDCLGFCAFGHGRTGSRRRFIPQAEPWRQPPVEHRRVAQGREPRRPEAVPDGAAGTPNPAGRSVAITAASGATSFGGPDLGDAVRGRSARRWRSSGRRSTRRRARRSSRASISTLQDRPEDHACRAASRSRSARRRGCPRASRAGRSTRRSPPEQIRKATTSRTRRSTTRCTRRRTWCSRSSGRTRTRSTSGSTSASTSPTATCRSFRRRST